jgi:hypothetical protein
VIINNSRKLTDFLKCESIKEWTVFKRQQKMIRRYSARSVVLKVGGTAPLGAVGLPRWALIGTRGGRERCYYHRGALVDK